MGTPQTCAVTRPTTGPRPASSFRSSSATTQSAKMVKMLPYELEYALYSAVYNALSFVMASMGASTVYFFYHAHLCKPEYRTAICISALVTLIAFYHYFRIFDSWNAAYAFKPVTADSTDYFPVATGIPFNDAYRYMDWLLTVPLLLLELVLVMKLDADTTCTVGIRLGTAAALMILLGYPGELITEGPELGTRWMYWAVAMCPFAYIVHTLLVGLKAATE